MNYSVRNQNMPTFKYSADTPYQRITNANTYISVMSKGSTSPGYLIGVNPNYYYNGEMFCSGRMFLENGQELKFLNPKAICGFKQRLWIMNGVKNLTNESLSPNGVMIVCAQGAGGGGGGGAGWNNLLNPEDAGGQGGHGGAGTITTVYSDDFRDMHIYGGKGGSGGASLSNGQDGERSYLGIWNGHEGVDVYCVCAEGGKGGGHGNQNQNSAYDNYQSRTTTHTNNPFDSSFVYREGYYYNSKRGGNVQSAGASWSGLPLDKIKFMWFYNWGSYTAFDIWAIKQWTGGDQNFSGGSSSGKNNVGQAGGGGASMGGPGGDAMYDGPTAGGYGAGGGGGTSRNGGGQTGGAGGHGYVTLCW